MTGKSIRMLTTILLIVLVLAACSSSSDGNSSQDDGANADDTVESELNIALSIQPTTLDTQLVTGTATREVSRNFYETLVTLDSNYQAVPMLAESIDESEDGKEYTFYLREGVKFHNGKEMTAEDVAASMNRWKELYPNAQTMLGDSEFEVADDYTVVLKLEKPAPLALIGIAGAKQIAAIMPREVVETAESSGVTEYIGTGPFKFVEWKQDQYIHLTKFDDYQPVDFAADGLAGKKEAFIDDIYYHFVTDGSTRAAGIQSGEYDIAENLSRDDYDMLEENPNVNLHIDHYGSATFVFNKKEGVFTDVNMRKAVNVALDFDEVLLAGFSNDVFYNLSPSYLYEEQVDWYSEAGKEFYNQNDPELAKQFLEKAGYDGEAVKLVTTRDYEYMYNMSVVVQEQLEQIGMNVELEVYDWATLDEVEQDPAKWDFANINFSLVTSPTDLLYLSPDWRGWNDDAEINDLLAEIAETVSPEERKELWEKAQARSWDYLPAIKLGDYNDFVASTDKVEDLTTFQGLILWNTKVVK